VNNLYGFQPKPLKSVKNWSAYFPSSFNKLYNLQRHVIAQNRTIHRVIQLLFQHNLKFYTIAKFKSIVEQSNDLNKSCRWAMSLSLYLTRPHMSKCNGSWVASVKKNYEFKLSTVFHIHNFYFLQEWSNWKLFILWRSISIQNLWFDVDWCKFCIHLRSLNVCHIFNC
jgi:hypothetical protein